MSGVSACQLTMQMTIGKENCIGQCCNSITHWKVFEFPQVNTHRQNLIAMVLQFIFVVVDALMTLLLLSLATDLAVGRCHNCVHFGLHFERHNEIWFLGGHWSSHSFSILDA